MTLTGLLVATLFFEFGQNLAAVVSSARRAHKMRFLHLATIRARDEVGHRQTIVCPSLGPTRARNPSLWYSTHDTIPLINRKTGLANPGLVLAFSFKTVPGTYLQQGVAPKLPKKSGVPAANHNYSQAPGGVKPGSTVMDQAHSEAGSLTGAASSCSPCNLRMPLRTTDSERSKSSSSLARTSMA